MIYIDDSYQDQLGRMNNWLERKSGEKLVMMEIGVELNTPGVTRDPFERLAAPMAYWTLVSIKPSEAFGPPGTISTEAGVVMLVRQTAGQVRILTTTFQLLSTCRNSRLILHHLWWACNFDR